MASGIFVLTRKLNADQIAIDGRIVWSSESNGTVKNSSKVTAELQLMKPNKATTTGTWTGSFTVGAKTVDVSKFLAVGGDWVTIETITTTVSHNADGTGTCYLQAKIDGPSGTSVRGSSTTGSTNVTLDKIARFATILSGEDFTDEGNPTITYSNPAGSAVSRLQACISLDGTHADVPYRDLPVNGKSYTFNLTDDERNTLRNATPNSNTLEVKFFIRSTIDGVTDPDSVKATMSIVNAKPSVSFSVLDTNEATITLTGNNRELIAFHSIAEVTLTASAKKGATIPEDGVRIVHGDVVLTESGTLSPVTNNPITFTVVDSRGNQVNGGVAGVLVPYFNPRVLVENAMPDGNGNMTLVATGKAYTGSFGSKTNALTIRYRYRTSSGTYPAWKTFSDVTWDGDTFTATEQITGLDYTQKYLFQAAVEDSLHAYPGVISKAKSITARPVFDWGEEDFQFHVPVYDQTGAQIGNSEDEWQNPPMLLGVQYRTTQRHLGKPVYAKLVDYGTLPNAGNKNVTYYGAGSTGLVDLKVMLSDGCILGPGYGKDRSFDSQNGMYIDGTKFSIRIYTEADFSGLTAYALVKYTID